MIEVPDDLFEAAQESFRAGHYLFILQQKHLTTVGPDGQLTWGRCQSSGDLRAVQNTESLSFRRLMCRAIEGR